MAELRLKIRSWFHAPAPPDLGSRQKAARDQLQGHIDAALLEGFVRKNLSADQHSEVVEHLNRCQDCQEAIAVALLSLDHPSAAAELLLEREKRAQEVGPWWRTALRWTGIVFALFAIAFLLYILPGSTAPESLVTKMLKSEAASAPNHERDSETTSGGWFATTLSSEEEPKPKKPERPQKPGRGLLASSGWNTGPAPYAAKVEGMPKAIEVEIPPEKLDPKTGQPSPNTSAPASTSPPSPAQHAVTPNRLLVTNNGELMRTNDGGTTWRVIIIKQDLALRSLAVSGQTIWAVGQQGAIYRSPDAANNWQQVIVKYRGVPVTSDIEQIRFTDEQHGEFQTADGESWITVNGGNTWVLSYRRQAH